MDSSRFVSSMNQLNNMMFVFGAGTRLQKDHRFIFSLGNILKENMLKAEGTVIVHWRAVDNQSFGSSDNSSRYLCAKNNEEAKKMLKSESAELNINDKYFGLRDNAWEVRVFNCDFYNPPEKYGEIGGIIGGRLSQSFEISRSS